MSAHDPLQSHPRLRAWAESGRCTPQDRDCTTAVVLKVLDHKCQMDDASQALVVALYDRILHMPGELFADDVDALIARFRGAGEGARPEEDIHQARLDAEARLPKPVMKAYKQRLRMMMGP